jgi:hypothetical protein
MDIYHIIYEFEGFDVLANVGSEVILDVIQIVDAGMSIVEFDHAVLTDEVPGFSANLLAGEQA